MAWGIRKVAERSICNSPAADSSFGSVSQGEELRLGSAWRGFSDPHPSGPADAASSSCSGLFSGGGGDPREPGEVRRRRARPPEGIPMQPDRGCRPRRGGGRPNRRRPGGREKPAESSGDDSHSRGGGGRGRRGTRGGAAASAPSAPRGCESATAEVDLPEIGKEDRGNYSRRKLVSNWHRYEESEKETQNGSGESQRGTDFSVLLSSAGDSFTQFRLAEEKEWISENLCPKQLSGLYVDCQSLVQALEELPLHLKLNVAAELVQDATPVTLPQIKLQSHDVAKKSGDLLQQQKRVGSHSFPKEDSAVPLTLSNKDGSGISSEALQRNPSSLHQVIDHLDEDLDLLLKLDAPISPESNIALEVVADGLPSGDDLTKAFEETEPGRTEEICSTSQPPEAASKNITEEELEDWLDSMIS
ncbi:cell death regulator Aven [Pituophis catenifer annectens]|uniref:cell death regulator Aven n=1 Tax=Pituophis catenifer annectens TaxID=94852 RepID=UPI003993FC9E